MEEERTQVQVGEIYLLMFEKRTTSIFIDMARCGNLTQMRSETKFGKLVVKQTGLEKFPHANEATPSRRR